MSSEREAPVSERAEQKKDHYDGQAVRDAWISGRLDRMKANLAPSWDDFLGVVEILKYEREFLGALSPVRAQEPTLLRYTPEQIEQQRQHCAEMQAFLRHTGTRANAPLKTATMCAEIAAVLDLYMEAIEAMALPPVQATTAEAEPRYCQKCGSNAIRTVEPGLFVCDWCDAVMRDKSSPLQETPAPDPVCQHGTALDVHCCNCHSGFIFDRDHECPASADEWREAIENALGVESDSENHTPAWAAELVLAMREVGNQPSPTPDLAQGRALEEACRVALDVFRNAGQLTGHSGDEESGQHDEDCFACHADAALAQLSAALEGAATMKEDNTR